MAKKAGSHVATNAPFDFDAQDINVSKLLLDPNNYRFLDRKKFKRKAANRFHEESVQNATVEKLEQPMSSTSLSIRSSPTVTCRWSGSSSCHTRRSRALLGGGGQSPCCFA